MRKLKLQVQMSVDGFIAGPNSEMDWMEWNWDDALKNYVKELTENVDCILLGRKLAQGFIPHWAANPELEGADIFNYTHKVIFTKTLEKSDWENTELEKGDLAEAIIHLKKQDGKDMIAYGGASFVSSLIKNNLIDEFHLFMNPTSIGNGLAIFNKTESNVALSLVKATTFPCGIVVLNYVPKNK